MATESHSNPLAFKIALVNLVAGVLAFMVSIFLTSLTSGFSQLSLGVFLLGAGEYLNNPTYHKQQVGNDNSPPPSYWNRKRNVCGLGNLLDIAGVIMVAIGTATLIFRQ